MRAAVLTDTGTVAVEERPAPAPDGDEVVVDVEAVGICGSDLHYFEHGRIGEYVVEEPLVLGHESAGVVSAVGDDVDALAPGDRVALEPGVPCGECADCRAGDYNRCPDVRFMATPPHDGAFVEAVAWPATFAHPIPDGLDVRAGALAEPVSVAVHACRRGDVGPGDDVLVTGAGPIGLLAADVAAARGATAVAVSDPVESKRRRARERGASLALDPESDDVAGRAAGLADGGGSTGSDGTGVDVAVEATGDPAALRDCLDAVRRGGTVVCVGLGSESELALDVVDLVDRELTLAGSFRFANAYPAAIDLLAAGRVDALDLVDFESGLGETQSALERARSPDVVKGMLRPQE